MKILLISGHGDGDSGAVGNGYKEADLTIELVKLIKHYLKKYIVDIATYDYTKNAYKDIVNGEFRTFNADYVFEVHFNSFKNKEANGTEIWVTTSENGTKVEEKVMKRLEKFFKVRGVKRQNFLVIKTCKRKGISSALIETCFISNKRDMEVYQEHKKEIAKAIADGIASGFGLKKDDVKEDKPPKKPNAKRGTKVKIKKAAKDLNTNKEYKDFVYENVYTVIKVTNDRVVFGLDGAITGATDIKNIIVIKD